MKDRLNNLFKHPIKKVYFFSIIAAYLLVTLTNITLSFYTFLAYGQEIKTINTQVGYTLTYDNQGGTGCTNKIQYGNNPWGELCTPTKTGYTFYGWYTEQDGGGTEVTSSTNATGNTTVYADYTTNTLYDVLKRAKKEGRYAREYTGSHQDSMNASLSTKKIYHWYGTSEANGTAILDKNNVIFGNHCWQMIRTTDTGGVRMIYNGEVVDGKCLNTRGTHVGYGGKVSSQSLNGTYWYGTDYTYSNGTFSLAGTKSSTQVTSSNGGTVIPTLVGKYTCKSTTESGTCSTLYLIESYKYTYYASAIPINSSSHYSQFGTLQFNADQSSPAYVGYMYNAVYKSKTLYFSYSIVKTSMTINTSWYYSSTISYSNGQYTLTNPQLISSLSNNSQLVGKYLLDNGGSGSNSIARYIVGIDGTTLYYRSLENGDLAISLMMGDSYTNNGNGTYTVNNATSVTYINWYNSDSTTLETYSDKYVCTGVSTTCSNLMRIINPYSKTFSYSSPENTYKYSGSVSYSNGTYTLTGDIETIWDLYDSTELAKINTHHYTCLSSNTSCTTVSYVNMTLYSSYIYYVALTGVSDIGTALNNMLLDNNVNAKNSTMKLGIDAWYKKYLLSYDNYIDDTIYCNNRSIIALGGFNPNGGSVLGTDSQLQFKEYNEGSDLSCTNITDKFSTSNSSAQLTYKVGLIALSEMSLLRTNALKNTGQAYWLLSPGYHSSFSANGRAVYNNGMLYSGSVSTIVSDARGARPAISLKSGIEYISGDGSMANPYVVDTNN